MSRHDLSISLSEEARDDLIEITLYGIATWGEAISGRYVADLYEHFTYISRFPQIGHLKEGVPNSTRVLGCGQHVIYYQHLGGTIRILRVLHARMDATHYLDL